MDTPFGFYLPDKIPTEAEGLPMHQWGEYLVVEKYPSVLKWLPPWDAQKESPVTNIFADAPYGRINPFAKFPPDYTLHKKGVIKCTNCHLIAGHELTWPDEAYYQWDIRGYRLWAWSERYARILLAFLGSMERDPDQFPGYQLMLRKLPKEVTSAKVRDLIVKEMSRALENG